MSALIKVKNLQLKYIPGSEISLEIERGQIIGITGKNGSGKSLFAAYLSGLIRPDKMGKIIIEGLDPFHTVDIPKIHKKVSIALQNTQDGIVFGHVRRDVIFGPENLGIDRDTILKRTEGLLKKFNVFSARHKDYSNLSGGEKQRAYLTAIFAMKPEIIILDEPFSMQDRNERDELVRWTVKTAKKYGQTLIVISHDRDYFNLFDKIYTLKKGRIAGNVEELEEDNVEEEGLSLSSDDGGVYFGEYHKEYQINDNISLYEYEGDNTTEESLIRFENVSFDYSKNNILSDFSFDFKRGRLYRFAGSTGSGKTTILSLMNGTKKIKTGNIYVKGNLIPKKGKNGWLGLETDNRYNYINSIRRNAGLVTQFPEDTLFENTVLEDVMYGPLRMGFSKEDAARHAREAMHRVGLEKIKWDMDPFKLSGGEKRCAAIAGILAMGPDILLMDEPFSGLDRERTEKIQEMLHEYIEEGHTVIITGH